MAVASSSPASSAKRKLSLEKKPKTNTLAPTPKPSSPKKPKTVASSPTTKLSSPAKRTKSPGIRVVGGRIYDSENGKTCHQCRQKTMDFVASCKNISNNKNCTIKFCHKCLQNRYGEKAEEMACLDSWKCPKCRGICNCSFCMKKRGHQPTGILVHAAKATGFSSVSDMLLLQTVPSGDSVRDTADVPPSMSPRSKSLDNKNTAKESTAPSNTSLVQNKGVGSNRKHKNANFSVENVGVSKKSMSPKSTAPSNTSLVQNKGLGSKRKHKEANSSVENGGVSKKSSTPKSKFLVAPSLVNNDGKSHSKKLTEKQPKKRKGDNRENVCNGNSENCDLGPTGVGKSGEATCLATGKIHQSTETPEKQLKPKLCKTKLSKKFSTERAVKPEEKVAYMGPIRKEQKGDFGEAVLLVEDEKKNPGGQSINTIEAKISLVPKYENLKEKTRNPSLDADENLTLPQADDVKTVAGIELHADDIGPALQFLEFCAAFGKVLDIKKGQPESVIRELTRVRIGRRGLNSTIVRFHLKLLSLIQKDLGEKSSLSYSTSSGSSWLKALAKCISESQYKLKELPLDLLNRGADGYDNLEPSKKLRLLNFLCDEALGTEDLRSWIDKENSKFAERKKEHKEKVMAAKEKEKDAKRKLKDELAKIFLSSKNGVSLSILEHDNLLSKIRKETEKAHTEKLQAQELLPKTKQRSDAVRTEPILLDGNGKVYWRLTGYSNKSNIMLQDIENLDLFSCGDKWFSYDSEQEKVLERHVSNLRMKRSKLQTTRETVEFGSDKAGIHHDSPSDSSSQKSVIEES